MDIRSLDEIDVEIHVNPRLPREQAERLTSWLYVIEDRLPGHLLFLTSGSSAASESDFKWVALSRSALRASARAVNEHLESGASDIWLRCLPTFHVGGQGIEVRNKLSGAKIIRLESEWDPAEFASCVADRKVTLASLVPTQVRDLTEANLQCPKCLRAIVVGGAALSPEAYKKARELGWPLLPSYGMTETASQIATAPLSSLDQTLDYPELQILPHLEVESTDSRIRVRGASLLAGYVHLDDQGKPTFTDPKDANGWLTTEDLGKVHGRTLELIGRVSERIKIGGELVNLARLREVLTQTAATQGIQNRVALIALPDERLESIIGLCIEPEINPAQLQAAYDRKVMPYEKIRSIKVVSEIPRTELGKVKWSLLAELAQEP